MLNIDGSHGEGGGQILRSSLALSMVTGVPFRVEKIRAGRRKPGLMRQHLTAVTAAARVSNARVEGAAIGSTSLEFRPGVVTPGEFSFAIGTAGSTTLVLQTVLPTLLCASGPSKLTLEGGTHNPFAPPFDFLAKAYLPLLNRMGPSVRATLERPGFFPAGGGRFTVEIEPAEKLVPIELMERGEIRRRLARAMIANLPRAIAEREVAFVGEKLGWPAECLKIEPVQGSPGPGNIVAIELESEHVTEVFTGFGEQGVPAPAVADEAVKLCREYLAAGVPVGHYLADQLMLLLALARGGGFRTMPLSRHSTTHIDLIAKFLDVRVTVEPGENGNVTVRFG